jgi:hypothetical protein
MRIKKRLCEKKVVVQNCDDDDDASSRRGGGGVIKYFNSLSLPLSLSLPRGGGGARAFFYSLSRAAFFLAFISLNFWAIMKDNSIA